ncbi:MAG: hypothetical protein QNJ89_12265, partial [Acidimicrobiia bacterium]|nr:hypothetical protein [Acidimicrobiia bacterium]
MKRRTILIGLLIALLAAGVVGLLRHTTPFSAFCTLDGLLVEEPPGWHLERDRANGCEWTLFNEAGDRAPRDLYDGLPIDPPPPLPLNPVRLLSSTAILLSLVGLSLMWLADRR